MLTSVAIVMTVTVTLSLAWIIYSTYNQGIKNLRQHGQLMVTMHANALAGPIWDMNKEQVDLLINSLKTDEAFLSAEVYDADQQLFSKAVSDSERTDDIPHTFSEKITHSSDGEKEVLGEFVLKLSQNVLYRELKENLISDIYLFIILLIVTLGTLYVVLRKLIINPLSHMVNTIENLKEDDMSTRFPNYGNNEFGALATAFNIRTEKLNEYYVKVQERKKELEAANENLKGARSDAEKANKSKSQFLANMSHELRTPLNAIIGYSEMLIEEAPELQGPEFVPELLKILSSGKHLLELINDILDISKIEAGKMDVHLEECSIKKIVDEIEHLVGPLVEKNANTFKNRVDEELDKAYTDVTKLRQNLLNLISNASKFTEKGRINLRVVKDGEFMLFQIQDTGIGMTPDQLGKIFQSFTQADSGTTKKYGGTGLGLAITKQFCLMLGGDIWAESQLGEGTSFFMKLPIRSKDPKPKSEDAA